MYTVWVTLRNFVGMYYFWSFDSSTQNARRMFSRGNLSLTQALNCSGIYFLTLTKFWRERHPEISVLELASLKPKNFNTEVQHFISVPSGSFMYLFCHTHFLVFLWYLLLFFVRIVSKIWVVWLFGHPVRCLVLVLLFACCREAPSSLWWPYWTLQGWRQGRRHWIMK